MPLIRFLSQGCDALRYFYRRFLFHQIKLVWWSDRPFATFTMDYNVDIMKKQEDFVENKRDVEW